MKSLLQILLLSLPMSRLRPVTPRHTCERGLLYPYHAVLTPPFSKSRGSSALVGYAAINGESGYRKALADFLSCGSEETAIDLYGLNE